MRGQVITVVDLRAKFSMASVEKTDQTCIIVVEICQNGQKQSIGIIVDRVSEVQDIASESIEDPPSLGDSGDADFILGMGKIGQSVKILLDIDKVLSAGEILGVSDTAKAALFALCGRLVARTQVRSFV